MGRHILEIVNELGQIFDRINIVMRRRRDQPNARHRVPQLADILRDLAARQLAPLTRLRALGHLDLNLIG